MYILEDTYEAPLNWEVTLLKETFSRLITAFEDYKKANGNRDPFDLEPHITTIQGKNCLEKRYGQVGLQARTFHPVTEDMIHALYQGNEKKIIAYRKNIIRIATWFAYNPPPGPQEMMVGS